MKTGKAIAALLAAAVLAFAAGCGGEKPDSRSELFINSAPDGARVFLRNKEIGITPLKVKLPQGTYIFVIEKNKYLPEFRRISCGQNEKHNIDAELEPVSASVMITSEPKGAFISMDGKQIGETPLIIHGQAIGKHAAQISMGGYVTQEISWTIEDARPQLVSVKLSSNMGSLSFSSEPPGAAVSIDGKYLGKTPCSGKFEQGEHAVKIEKPDYTVFEQKVTLARDEEKTVEAVLALLPGGLKITSNPTDAECSVNGKPTRNTPVELSNIPPGQYEIKLHKGGFDDISETVTVSPGQTAEKLLVLGSNLGGIDLVVNPPGVTIYLDGKKIGVTAPDESQPGQQISKVFEIRGVTSGKHTLMFAHSRATPPEKTITVEVKKGQITRPKQITLWIADTYVKLRNGKTLQGRLRQENQDEIIFEPEPSIAIRYAKPDIETIKKLDDKE